MGEIRNSKINIVISFNKRGLESGYKTRYCSDCEHCCPCSHTVVNSRYKNKYPRVVNIYSCI